MFSNISCIMNTERCLLFLAYKHVHLSSCMPPDLDAYLQCVRKSTYVTVLTEKPMSKDFGYNIICM